MRHRVGGVVRAGLAVLAVVGCLVALLAVHRVDAPDEAVTLPSTTTVAPDSAMLACPKAPTTGRPVSTVLAASPRADAQGRVRMRVLARGRVFEASLVEETAARVGLRHRVDPRARSQVVVTGEGEQSTGLTATQVTVERGPDASGLAVTACPAPADRWWFSGVDTDAAATSRLDVTNPTSGLAVVDVLVYSSTGRIAAPGSRGIAIGPYGHRSLPLERLAPGVSDASLQVRTQRGQVVAAVHTARTDGVRPAGSEWIAPTTSPATDVLVNPGIAGRGDRTLLITNPGAREALVQVQAFSANGAFRPSELTDLRVPPGSVLATTITELVDREGVALRLQSTVGVLAGVASTTATARQDFTVSGASLPLRTDPAVVAVLARVTTRVCAASKAAATSLVTIEQVGTSGAVSGREVLPVRVGRTACLDVEPARGTAYLLVSADASDDTQALATYVGRSGVASVPVSAGVWEITRPPVVPAP